MVAYTGWWPSYSVAELTGFDLIDSEESLDVAVFRGLEDRVELPGSEFIDFPSSYLADPVPGDHVTVVGYLGANVKVTRRKARFGLMSLDLSASSVSEKRIVLANEHGERQFVHYEDPTCHGIPLGGLSGSPAFVDRSGRARFVGIVTDGSDKDQTLLISRLGCLRPDGTLDRNLIP